MLAVLGSVLVPLRSANAAGGVAFGASGSTGPCGTRDASSFATWRGRPNGSIVDTLDMRRFSNIAAPDWWTGCSGCRRSGRVRVGDGDVRGRRHPRRRSGWRRRRDVPLPGAEAGRQAGSPMPGSRLGFEFNGEWFPWRAAADPTAFTDYYRRIVDVMRSVPGQDFKFVWNPTIGVEEIPPSVCGRAVPTSTPSVSTSTTAAGHRHLPGAGRRQPGGDPRTSGDGLAELQDDGRRTRLVGGATRPHRASRWRSPSGLIEPAHHGGGDNPLFIERMRQWIVYEPHRLRVLLQRRRRVGVTTVCTAASTQTPRRSTSSLRCGCGRTARDAPAPTATPTWRL